MPTPRSRRDVTVALRAPIPTDVDPELVSRVAAVARASAPAAEAAVARGPAGSLAARLRVAGVALAVAGSTAGVALAAGLLAEPAPAPAPADGPRLTNVDDPTPADRSPDGTTRTEDEPSEAPGRTRSDRRDDGARPVPPEPTDVQTGTPGGPGPASDEDAPDRSDDKDTDQDGGQHDSTPDAGDLEDQARGDDRSETDGGSETEETDRGSETEETDDGSETDDSAAVGSDVRDAEEPTSDESTAD